MTKRKDPKDLLKTGRKTKMTKETLDKLQYAYCIGCNDTEACSYAEISHQTLHTYQRNNPEFVEKKVMWKEKPILKAKKAVCEGLEGNPEFSLKYLERKRKNEFGLKSTMEHIGDEDKPINTKVTVEFVE